MVVVEANDPDSIITIILGITSKINTYGKHNLYSLKNSLPENEEEAIDKLIIPFLMSAIIESKDD